MDYVIGFQRGMVANRRVVIVAHDPTKYITMFRSLGISSAVIIVILA